MTGPRHPFVSVVMPLYNKESEVGRAIGSVLAQSFQGFELIVVDDGSTDRGPDVVAGIEDARIRMIRQENAGVSAARNRGIEEAKSDLIAFLDADDEWKPSCLETIFHLKNKFPTCKVFATNYIYREVDGTLRLPIIKGLPPHPWEGILDNYFEVASKSDPPLWTSAVAVDKKAIASTGMFPVGVTSGEDLLTWAKLAVDFDIAYSSKPGAVFWLRASLSGPPVRLYDEVDSVGPALLLLLRKVENHRKDSVREYIALWHRMRASTFLKIGRRREALLEIKKIRKFSKPNLLIYLYLIIVIIPDVFFNITVKCFSLIKAFRRRIVTPSVKKK